MQQAIGQHVVSICTNRTCKFSSKDLCGRPCLVCGSPTLWFCRDCFQPITDRFSARCHTCGNLLKY